MVFEICLYIFVNGNEDLVVFKFVAAKHREVKDYGYACHNFAYKMKGQLFLLSLIILGVMLIISGKSSLIGKGILIIWCGINFKSGLRSENVHCGHHKEVSSGERSRED